MQINSVNSVNFGIWKDKNNKDILLDKLSKQARSIYSPEDIKAMYDEFELSENLYKYDKELKRILKFDKRKGRYRNIHKKGFTFLDVFEREYSKLLGNHRLSSVF